MEALTRQCGKCRYTRNACTNTHVVFGSGLFFPSKLKILLYENLNTGERQLTLSTAFLLPWQRAAGSLRGMQVKNPFPW